MRAITLSLLPAILSAVPTVAAQPAVLPNACGVPVHHALVEIGSHKPPQIFTPELNNGRMEFNFLGEASEPLTAMCFRTAEESSLFRVPLPPGLERCAFTAGALTCSPAPTGDTTASGPSRGLPPAVAKEMDAWRKGCGPSGRAVFSDDYLSRGDIDRDGAADFILNGDGATCVENGRVVARGGGNGGTSLKIFMGKGKAADPALDIFTQSAEITAHKGFAILRTPEGTYRLAGGKAAKSKPVAGGELVYTLER